MPDTPRRSALQSRAETLRRATDTLSGKLVDQAMKDLIRRAVIYPLNDVQTLFLGDAHSRPSAPTFETRWLDFAEIVLRGAEEQFRSLSETIDKYGGPENMRTIG